MEEWLLLVSQGNACPGYSGFLGAHRYMATGHYNSLGINKASWILNEYIQQLWSRCGCTSAVPSGIFSHQGRMHNTHRFSQLATWECPPGTHIYTFSPASSSRPDSSHSVQSKGTQANAYCSGYTLASNAYAGRDLSASVQTARAAPALRGHAVAGVVNEISPSPRTRQGKFICIAQFNDKVIQSALQRH